MPFATFKKQALSEDIVVSLLNLIRTKELRPGEKLPPERELATIMQVSRPSLREALRALSIMNVIEIRQGDGTYVTSLEPDLLLEHLDFVYSLNDATISDFFEARRITEVGITGLAAKRITDEEIADLELVLAKSIDSVDDLDTFLQTDIDLHEKIAQAARNDLLSRFMSSVTGLGHASRRRTAEIPGVRQQTVIDHEAIVTALKARDTHAARRAMLQHLNNIENKLKEFQEIEDHLELSRSVTPDVAKPPAKH